MRREPRDRFGRLCLELVPQDSVFRVGGAREEEILPDQQSVLVAEFVEILGFVHAPTPYAKHIHVRRCGVFDALLQRFAGDPSEEHIVRNPVGASDIDVLAVDDESERAAIDVGREVEFDAAESDAFAPGGEHGLACDKSHIESMERLVAVASRPPEAGVRGVEPHVYGCLTGTDVHGRLSAGDGEGQMGGAGCVISPLQVHVHIGGGNTVSHIDEGPDRRDSRSRSRIDADRLPDSG